MQEPGVFLSFGTGVRLRSEDDFIRLFPPGLTRKGFRSLCRALSVPMLEVGRTRYVDTLSLLLALRSILRVGEPDFLTPGCHTLRNLAQADRARCATRLDTSRFQRNLTSVISELVAASRINGVRLSASVSEAATKAAQRMVLAGIHHFPVSEQETFTRSALTAAKKDRIIGEEEDYQASLQEILDPLPPDSDERPLDPQAPLDEEETP
jgi:hypothetical protein